jgi:hypothetical protein
MGFFGKVWGGVKNIFSGIGKAFTGVVNFVKSAFSGKNIWKTLAIGSAAYFGGAALGYWDSKVLTNINGAWADNKVAGTNGWLGDKVRDVSKVGSDVFDSLTGDSAETAGDAVEGAAEEGGLISGAIDAGGDAWNAVADSSFGQKVGDLVDWGEEHPNMGAALLKGAGAALAPEPRNQGIELAEWHQKNDKPIRAADFKTFGGSNRATVANQDNLPENQDRAARKQMIGAPMTVREQAQAGKDEELSQTLAAQSRRPRAYRG